MKRLFLGAIVITILLTQLSLGDNVTPLWTKTYNGATNGNDYGMGIAVDISGNIYVTGYESVTGQGNNIWTRKYDNNGSEVWTKTHNGVTDGSDQGRGIAVDSSGNVYAIGNEEITGQSANIWIRKYDNNGAEIWTRTYNGVANGVDMGSGIAVDISGNVYVTGSEEIAGHSYNIWTRKYNSNGAEIWTRTYNGAANSTDSGIGIAVDDSGNVYVTGTEEVTGQSYNIWTRKYDSSGSEVWTKTYNGSANASDYGNGIAVDDIGNVYVTGCETVAGQNFSNTWTRKYDSNGTEVWTRTYNGAANSADAGRGVAVDSIGNVYVTGCETVTGQSYNIWTRKYDSDGSEVWTKTYNGNANGTDVGSGITVDSSGNIYVTGYTFVSGENGNIWTGKYGQQTSVTLNDTGYFKIIGGKEGYVNPNNGEVANFIYKTLEVGTIIFKVYNLKSEMVKTVSSIATGPTQFDSFDFNCKNEDGNVLSSGIYIVKAEGPGLSIVKKLAIIK
ncbi:MAG: hypothetical protein A2452_02135 [Candidatus Firestonebacteria bacterium RIFOXYC2_FULL_39_67]|nr:MAG: hypothetical protein A2536_07025 [Candidatus Firestonebacteria bacterium RIFOXYD2_FULL_39_29]OGF57543.1 MAG: hypothetical protein A2452_02135 [Candidatus Firestonebacteria bacterium RIFOXYC2_FULL_39_67]